MNVVTINNVDSVPQSSSLETHKPRDTHTVLSKAYIGQNYKDIFGTNLGKLPMEYRRKADPEAEPVIRPPKRIFVSIQDNIKTELERMVKIGVIKPLTELTSWMSSFVAVKKKGKMNQAMY